MKLLLIAKFARKLSSISVFIKSLIFVANSLEWQHFTNGGCQELKNKTHSQFYQTQTLNLIKLCFVQFIF